MATEASHAPSVREGTSAPATPLFDILSSIRMGDVVPFCGTASDMACDLLQQAHAMTILMRKSIAGIDELETRCAESALATTSARIKVDAVEGMSVLLAISSALIAEG